MTKLVTDHGVEFGPCEDTTKRGREIKRIAMQRLGFTHQQDGGGRHEEIRLEPDDHIIGQHRAGAFGELCEAGEEIRLLLRIEAAADNAERSGTEDREGRAEDQDSGEYASNTDSADDLW